MRDSAAPMAPIAARASCRSDCDLCSRPVTGIVAWVFAGSAETVMAAAASARVIIDDHQGSSGPVPAAVPGSWLRSDRTRVGRRPLQLRHDVGRSDCRRSALQSVAVP